MTNKYERARSPIINQAHYSPPDDLHIEQKKLDKLYDVFRKSDTVGNHTIQRFDDGKANTSMSTEEEDESSQASNSSSSENGSMINDLTINEE